MKFDPSAPTQGQRRYHIVVYFPKEKAFEAHIPVHRDQPRRIGAFERRDLRGRAGVRSALAAGRQAAHDAGKSRRWTSCA